MQKPIKEIEVKARVENFDALINKLEKLGCKLSKPIVQDDKVFLPNGIGVDNRKKGINALRIRKENGKIIFNLKQRGKVTLSHVERELEIGDVQIMEDIIRLLGFYEFQTLKKKRRKCHYNEYEICLDEVDDLGTFIEIEKMSDGDDKEVQDELFQFLESLGVKREDRAIQGYDILLHMKLHPRE